MEKLESKRLVVKIGSNVITSNGYGLDHKLIGDVASQVVALRRRYGVQTVIVSSGAVTSGMLMTGSLNKESVLDTQAAAIIGQPALIAEWVYAFRQLGEKAGQVLYKDDDLLDPPRPLLRALDIATVIANGNDAVFNREIKALMKAADNDLLSSHIAVAINAQMLIALTSVDGVLNPYNKIIPLIRSNELVRIKKAAKTENGTGGMRSKITSIQDYVKQTDGIGIITNGKVDNVIWRISQGEKLGTWIMDKKQPFVTMLTNRIIDV